MKKTPYDMKVSVIVVLGRLWHDGTNTYHSTRITVYGTTPDGKPKTDGHVIPFTPGYDEHYLHVTAADWLDTEGFVDLKTHRNGSREPLWQFCRDHDITLIYDKVNVSRKKDL